MMKQSGSSGIVALLLGVVLVGCTSAEKRQEQADAQAAQQEQEQAQQQEQAEAQAQGEAATPPAEQVSEAPSAQAGNGTEGAGQVVQEKTEVIPDSPTIGGTTVSESQATIPVRRRITRTVISQNQIPTVRVCEERADVNRMDQEDFVAIGFTNDAARNVIQQRQTRGGFRSISELARVPGVDVSLLRQLEPELGFPQATQQAGEVPQE